MPAAQLKYNGIFEEAQLEWKGIYSIKLQQTYMLWFKFLLGLMFFDWFQFYLPLF